MSEPKSPQRSNLVPLRGADTTPELVLRRTLDKVGEIKAVSLVFMWTDEAGSVSTDWSHMKLSELLWMSESLRLEVADRIRAAWVPSEP